MLPKAPSSLPNIEPLLKQAMDAWMKDDLRPRLNPIVEARWDGYIEQWVTTPDLPLFVRVGKGDGFEKGCSISRHGRMLIRCDNSPAKWIFRRAYENPALTFDDLRNAWERKEIPVALVVTGAARKKESFIGLPSLRRNGVGDGWELSHRRPVRLDGRLDAATSKAFEQHFRLLMSVSNMVLTPSKMGMNHLVDWYFREQPQI